MGNKNDNIRGFPGRFRFDVVVVVADDDGALVFESPSSFFSSFFRVLSIYSKDDCLSILNPTIATFERHVIGQKQSVPLNITLCTKEES